VIENDHVPASLALSSITVRVEDSLAISTSWPSPNAKTAGSYCFQPDPQRLEKCGLLEDRRDPSKALVIGLVGYHSRLLVRPAVSE
jgi:hypothetical protein